MKRERALAITEEEKEILKTFEKAIPGLTADQKRQLQSVADALLVLSRFKEQISA